MRLIVFLLIAFAVLPLRAQAQGAKTVTGVVTDETGDPLPGVTVVVKTSTRGVITGLDGKFAVSVAADDILVFSYLGMKTQEVAVDARSEYSVQLRPQENELEEAVVVAFATQKKESVISAVTTVSPKELKVPSSNLTTALAGRMSGLIAYQQSGEPGNDNAQFFIRGVTTFGYKKDPLILIDNIELTSDDLARLNVDDIAQFSIMKDATATALYGARGANGVIIVTTKEGQAGKPKVSVRYEHAISQPTQMVSVADPITYMQLNNEAVNTRRSAFNTSLDAGYTVFSPSKIDNTIAGTNPYMYPAVDWYRELFNDFASTDRANINLSGGSERVRYYIAASYSRDNGVLKNEKLNNYNTNIDLNRYTVRSNTNIDLTGSTEVAIRVNGSFDDYVGPLNGGDQLFNKVIRTSPVLYPKSYPAVGEYAGSTHVLFGNTDAGNYLNPYADMVKGYKESNKTTVVAQAELKQKLDVVTKGLEARLLISTTRYSDNEVLRYSVPYQYQATTYDPATDTYFLKPLNTDGEEYLGYHPGDKNMNTTNYVEGSVSYNRTFLDRHAVSAMLVYIRQESKTANAETLQLSLPRRNQGVSGRFTYAYDSRYFTELNFGYNGSERFSANERYGFFPSVGVGYILSNEKFWEPLLSTVDLFKLKFTYGLVGNDAIGEDKDRFYYLSEVNMDDEGRRQHFGEEYANAPNGISNSRYPNPYITWETSTKSNFGVELGLFDKTLELQADLFYEYRTNIYLNRAYIPSSMGLSAGVSANLGEASSRGVDLSMTYSFISGQDYWLRAMGNFTYAKGQFEVYEEPDYAALGEPWRTRVGQPIAHNVGYIAERLFIDEYDIINSPTQTFGMYQAGDIKYKDINGDGRINESDQVFLGYPNQPEITYGFGVSGGYKGFDLSVFFQGNARVTFFLEPNKIAPFVDGLSGDDKDRLGIDRSITAVNNLLSVIADDHWSEGNRDLYAFWPRLSPNILDNNTQRSTWWMHNASFMRLKTVELGYTLPAKLSKKLKMQMLRVYVTGNNLLTFSGFKLWDPEMGANGLGYPVQRVYNMGININF
jgi:TonB-linked SusC/RagA family outer membrane protein